MTKFYTLLGMLAMIAGLQGCRTVPDDMKPVTEMSMPERIEATALAVGILSDKIEQSTCGTFENKVCTDPAAFLYPDEAAKAHKLIEEANDAIQATRVIPAGEVGACLGEQRSQADCLKLVDSLIAKARAYLISNGGSI